MTPKVAVSADFLRAFSKLPKGQQKKVRALTEKFRADPKQAALNYEPIHDVVDDKVRTVRVDKAYRAVVIHPPKGDVYLFAWVDHHDKAMDWARKRRFEVNPASGAFQVYQEHEAPSSEVQAALPRAPDAEDRVPEGRLLEGALHDDLVLLGVPESLLPSVRALRTEYDLDDLAGYLPPEASDALYALAAGSTVQEAFDDAERARQPKEVQPAVDVEDFATALATDAARQSFKVVESESELDEVLGASLELWRVFLHPSQRSLVEKATKGSVRVLGGAGTGKTVVLMHRARHLARRLLAQPDAADARVLVTTFTRNLAHDLRRNLRNLCTPKELERIEVDNLNRWADGFLKTHGVKFRVAKDSQRERAWEAALTEAPEGAGHSEAFYREEWDKVVQANDVVSWEGYRDVSRRGRGVPLGRKQRKAVWRVLDAYRRVLDEQSAWEFAGVVREARLLAERNPKALPYAHVLADETQDFRTADLRLLRSLVPEGPDDLFLVGDAHQRIYGHRASLTSCGINVRGRRSRRLKVNYRTTDKICRWSVARLEGLEFDDLDEGLDTLKGYRSLRLGTLPRIESFKSDAQEGAFVTELLQEWLEEDGVEPEDVCLALRRGDPIRDRYLPLLEQAGIKAVQIKRDSDDDPAKGIRLATFHRLKGLEFKRIVIAAANEGEIPLRHPAPFASEKSREEYEQGERCLLYVAATRARDQLLITSYGKPSPWV